jgi:hypothetical protein
MRWAVILAPGTEKIAGGEKKMGIHEKMHREPLTYGKACFCYPCPETGFVVFIIDELKNGVQSTLLSTPGGHL